MESHAVSRAVEEGAAEIGIASVVGTPHRWRTIPLLADNLGVVCRLGHPLASKKGPLTWADIAAFPFIENGLCGFVSAPQIDEVLENSTIAARNMTSLIALVSKGLGITILPELSAASYKNALQFRRIEGVADRRELQIIMRAGSVLSPAVETFIETLRGVVGEEGFLEKAMKRRRI